ncbi:MAG: hypothetical protein KJ820_16370 [Bacteroidetes bacterium]|nr:hypothetical protein [Bacteroidota bacterium]
MDNLDRKDIVLEKSSEEELSPKKPLSYGSYLTLDLSDEEADRHKQYILDSIDDIVEDPDRKAEMDMAEVYRNQYAGVVGKKFPDWGFNLDMRLTPKIQDAVVAQTEEAFDDADPHWSVGPIVNKDVMAVRDKQETVLDYFEDTEMDNVEDIESIRHDSYLFGLGWEAMIFSRKFERMRQLKKYETLEEFISDFPNDYQKYKKHIEDLANGKPVVLVVNYNQEMRRSPYRKFVEYEDAIVPITAKGVDGVNAASLKGRRVWLKWAEIKELEEDGDYIKGVSEKLRWKVKPTKDNKDELDSDYLTKDYETFEMIYDAEFTVDGKKQVIRTLWNIEKEHGVLLRKIRYPYHHNRCYLIPHCIQYTRPGLFQDGIGKKLHDLHIAANATINHILDASIIANSLTLKTRKGSGAAQKIYEHQWYPGSVLELQNVDDAQQFSFGTPNLQSLIQLFSIIERFGSDVTGVVNYTMGIADPEDPEAPASKTIALMRKAEIKLRRYVKNLKRSENEAGYQALRLIYQFTPAEKLGVILGDAEGVDITKQFLQTPLKVITNASGFAIEKIFAKRDDMMMMGNLLKEPLVGGDPIRRSRLWYTVAKDFGSNWDKKIIGIVPTPEELEAEKQRMLQEKQQKKISAIQQAAQKALEAGASPESAREVGLQAGKFFEEMSEKQSMMAQQQQQENKK